ncbi:Chitobiose-specific regulator ChbR AraCfamily [Salmonella sp. NCTC 11881]|nr:Chitobiose-specific regulator ChbR AraCfamily [Salmonella sp. NCTC 11881]
MMQLQVNATEIKTVYEQQLFNGKKFPCVYL